MVPKFLDFNDTDFNQFFKNIIGCNQKRFNLEVRVVISFLYVKNIAFIQIRRQLVAVYW